MHSRYECRSRLVVIALSEDVAWAARPIDSFYAGSHRWSLARGRVDRLEDALRSPELALLSAVVHGEESGGEDIVLTALAATQQLAASTREHYTDLIDVLLGRVTPDLLEAWMSFHGYELQGPTFKRKVAEAAVTTARRFLRIALEARGISLPPDGDARLEACTDVEQLERWFVAVSDGKTELE